MGDKPSPWSTVGVLTVIVAIISVGFWFFMVRQPGPQLSDLSTQVEDSMQDYLRTDPTYANYNVRVIRVDLNKVSDTKFEGVATVTTAQTPRERIVPVDVTLYGERMVWKVEPGAFMFLMNEPVPLP